MTRRRARRHPLNREAHDALGAELYAARNWTLGMTGRLANRYGRTTRVGVAAEKLQKAIDHLRCVLDDQAAIDLGEEFAPTLYYRGTLPAEAQ